MRWRRRCSLRLLAVRRHADFTEVYVGLPGMLTVRFLRNLVEEVGMTPLVDRPDYCGIGAGLCYVVALSDGRRTLTLPPGYGIKACGTGPVPEKVDGTQLQMSTFVSVFMSQMETCMKLADTLENS